MKKFQKNYSKFYEKQFEKIDSWVEIPIPIEFLEIEEVQKINVIKIIIKPILINCKSITDGIISLNEGENYISSAILFKTLIENTINLRYSLKFYQDNDYTKFEKIIKKSEKMMFGDSISQKSRKAFRVESIAGKQTTRIYKMYQDMCKIAHPDFKQLIAILKNGSQEFNVENLLNFDLSSKIISDKDAEDFPELLEYLLKEINSTINDITSEHISRFKNNDLISLKSENGVLNFNLNGGVE